MANIQHNSLTTTDLHENKGVSAAANNTVATASSGATVWKLLDNSNLGTLANSFPNFAQFQEQQPNGSNSALTALTGSSYLTIPLNTTVVGQSWATGPSSNQITLQAGTYIVHAEMNMLATSGPCQLKLRNITSNTDILYGQNGCTKLTIDGTFTLGGSTIVAIQGRGKTQNTTMSNVSAGNTEVYGELMFWKVG